MSKANQTFTKYDYEKAVKKSVSMPTIMFNRAVAKARQRGFTTFSDYIQDLLRRDHDTAIAG